ncbi:MAG: class I SAM-dependent methyltransferase [Alphaproteobacteria bacterium]|nr:class I SAM-dependent methyltransferase [Alphaproteobacteria bacterium]
MPDADWWIALWPDPTDTLRQVGIGGGMTVIDLCCGDGYFTAPMIRLIGDAGHVYAVDLDPEMLTQAKAAVEDERACTWIEADARSLAGQIPNPVDYVLIANTFHGIPDQPAFCEGVARALRPGGRFAIINWHKRPRVETPVLNKPRGPASDMRMTPADTEAVVIPAGFALEKTVELAPYHYGAVFKKTL